MSKYTHTIKLRVTPAQASFLLMQDGGVSEYVRRLIDWARKLADDDAQISAQRAIEAEWTRARAAMADRHPAAVEVQP